ncbi:MAG: GNAT family N-acetyltransferase [Pseudomonadales bacterium]|nr:GNAT family N-acetyltransferase [Pseudomonadales bacterium]MCP5356931.1 GNAT family N-acetyltransferase [Pseudomonadales bacterium]
MKIIGPELDCETECEAILRSLPQWFGLEESLKMYVRDSRSLPTFAAKTSAGIAGFITLQQHFPAAWEVHCIAVSAHERGKGVGTILLSHTETWLAEQGVRFLQVKTIAASSPDPHYSATRAFYLNRGYIPVEEFPLLWSPTNPALLLIKAIDQCGR